MEVGENLSSVLTRLMALRSSQLKSESGLFRLRMHRHTKNAMNAPNATPPTMIPARAPLLTLEMISGHLHSW
jgi:hypothetical protein